MTSGIPSRARQRQSGQSLGREHMEDPNWTQARCEREHQIQPETDEGHSERHAPCRHQSPPWCSEALARNSQDRTLHWRTVPQRPGVAARTPEIQHDTWHCKGRCLCRGKHRCCETLRCTPRQEQVPQSQRKCGMTNAARKLRKHLKLWQDLRETRHGQLD